MAPNAKSFMIDDILREEETEKRAVPDVVLQPEAISHYNNFILSNFYSQLPNASSSPVPHPSSVPAMQDARVQTLFWQHLFLRRKIMLQLKPRKGGQIRFSHQQIIDLEKRFQKNKYLSATERKKLAARISLSERQVKTWFQNRRAKWRRGMGLPDSDDRDSDTQEQIVPDVMDCETETEESND